MARPGDWSENVVNTVGRRSHSRRNPLRNSRKWIMEILDLDNNRLGCIMVTDGMDHPVVGRRRPDERFGDDELLAEREPSLEFAGR